MEIIMELVADLVSEAFMAAPGWVRLIAIMVAVLAVGTVFYVMAYV